jgi:hypothetical protein
MLFVSTLVFAFYAYRFGITILRVEDSVEECLDVLDERYESISKVLEIPLFDDSPQIKTVHKDIKRSRDAILGIANVLTNSILDEEEQEQ